MTRFEKLTHPYHTGYIYGKMRYFRTDLHLASEGSNFWLRHRIKEEQVRIAGYERRNMTSRYSFVRFGMQKCFSRIGNIRNALCL